MKLKEYIKTNFLYLDGGMGTLLQAKGLAAGELPERWNLTHPEEIRAIQKAEKERQAAAMAAAKQRRAQYALDDDDEEDVDIPVIRSHFDNDDEPATPAPAQKKTSNKKKK